jgi:putative peptide zinc metalloprotease protein
MWISPVRQRVVVDLVGLYLHAILAGIAGICAFFLSHAYPELTLFLELFALISYLLIVTNLSPGIELDGYYALMDLLNKPNLRISTVKWLISEKKPFLKSVKENYKEAIYCGVTIVFIFGVGTIVPYLVFKYLLHGLFGVRKPPVSIFLVTLAVLMSSFAIYRDIRKYSRK